MNVKNNYATVCKYVPERLRQSLNAVSSSDRDRVNEIRLRVNRPITVSIGGKSLFVTRNGGFSDDPVLGLSADKHDITETLKAICSYSVHSYTKELSQGFITIENGIRAGIAGTASPSGIKYINAVNFRLPRQAVGCGDTVCRKLFSDRPKGLLICGGVSSGKTTLLRDICRILGNRYLVSLVDERNELAGCSEGIPRNDIGCFTDVLDGYGRAEGIVAAIRSLSPQIIMCDEISSEHDSQAILRGAGCGVKFIATAHGDSVEDLRKRAFISELLDSGVFEYAAVMSGSEKPGIIREILQCC